ncbi:MAG: hypothetical protein WC781_04305 [Candidatus Pacearchaeota archaeon]|jgi:hypothetical protein
MVKRKEPIRYCTCNMDYCDNEKRDEDIPGLPLYVCDINHKKIEKSFEEFQDRVRDIVIP